MHYELGVNDADYVADVLQINLKDARGILHDCPGANGYQMLAVVLENEENKNRVMGAKNRAGYVRVIVRANVARILAQDPFPQGRNANTPAKPMEQNPPPVPRPPLPSKAAPNQADALVRDAIHALGNNRYTAEEIAEQITRGGIACTNILKLQMHLASMIRRGLVHFVQGLDRVVRYSSLEARKPSVTSTAPVAPVSPAILQEAQAPAVVVEVTAIPAPAAEASHEDRILAAIDDTPRTFMEISAITGMHTMDVSPIVHQMIDRKVVVKQVENYLIRVSRKRAA